MSSPLTVKVVVEGPLDAQIIRAILDKESAARLRFFVAQGRVSLATVGRNILVHEGGPVLLVMDSDTRDQQLVEERQSMARVALSGVAPAGLLQTGAWYKVFSFVPELEVIFFEVPQVLEQLMGAKLSEENVRQGLLAPKETLLRILGEATLTYPMLLERMDAEVAKALALGRQANALRETVGSLLHFALSA